MWRCILVPSEKCTVCEDSTDRCISRCHRPCISMIVDIGPWSQSEPGSRPYRPCVGPDGILDPPRSSLDAFHGCWPWMLSVGGVKGCYLVYAIRGCHSWMPSKSYYPWMLSMDAIHGCVHRYHPWMKCRHAIHGGYPWIDTEWTPIDPRSTRDRPQKP